MHPCNNPVKQILHLHIIRDVARTDPFGSFNFFSILHFSGHPSCTHFRNFKWPCIMLYAKTHEQTVVQLLHCLSLSSCQLESTLPPAAQLLLSQSKQGTWSGITYDFQTSLREFLDPVVNCSVLQTLPTINRKHFFMNILCIESFCPQKHTTERCLLVLHSSSTFAILTTETSIWTCASIT
jgi:hypothetical protein